MSVGLLSFLAVGVESFQSSTNAYSAVCVDYIPFTSETLDINRGDIPDPSLASLWDEQRVYNGLESPGGNIAGVVHPNAIGYLCRVAFDASTVDNLSTDFGGAGTAGSHGAVKAHRFTTRNTQFHAGSGSDLPTVTLEAYRGPIMPSAAAQGSSFVFYNMAGNTLEFAVDAGGLLRFSCDLLGRDFGGKPNIAPPNVAPAFRYPQAFLWSQASLSVAGVGATIYENLSCRLENNLEAVPKLDGRLRPDLVKRNDFRRVSFSSGISFQNFVDFDRFRAGSEAQMIITFRGQTFISGSGHNNMLRIDVPRARWATFPIPVGGPGRITIGATGRGVLDPTSGYTMEVTVVCSRTSGWHLNAAA